MALPNGDLITTPFDPQMAYPSDRRMQVDTLNSRDSMSMFIRWEGMEVYVLETSKKYILQGGRSNEYWKETGTGTGTGGTTFVGQFPTADLLPTSGRSAGDYAFVGTGDDFVQYNWDNIANQWVMAEGQTDMASEFFHIGYKTPLRRPVIFPLFPKDVLVQESGDFVFTPETDVARFIFTGEVTAIRGIETAAADREIKLVNRTGSYIPLRDKASGIPSDSGFDFGGTDYTWVNGSEITLKGNGTYWQLAPNNQIAFSYHLDSVNAQVSVGPDGKIVLSNVINPITGRYVTLKEVTKYADGSDMSDAKVDGIYYIKYGAKYFADTDFLNSRIINVMDFGAVGDGVTDDTIAIQNAFDLAQLISDEYVDREINMVTVLFPACRGYKTTDKVTLLGQSSIVMHSNIIYEGTRDRTALEIGRPGRAFTNKKIQVAVVCNTPDWSNENFIGVNLINTRISNVRIVEASGFHTGVQFIGLGFGVVYNDIKLGRLRLNKIALHLFSLEGGWVNENVFTGGSFSGSGSMFQGINRYGIVTTNEEGHGYSNANTFIKPSFEIAQNAASPGEAIPIVLNNSSYNKFINCRSEGNSNIFIRTTGSSAGNEAEISFGTGTARIEDLGQWPTTLLKRGNKLLNENSNSIYRIANIKNKLNQYSATQIYAQDEIGVIRSTDLHPREFDSSITLDEQGVSMFLSRGICLNINTEFSKRFFINTTHYGDGGLVFIACFDENGVRLESGGRVRTNYPFASTYSDNHFGGSFLINNQVTGFVKGGQKLYFNVSDDVKSVYVILCGSSSNTSIKLSSIDILSIDQDTNIIPLKSKKGPRALQAPTIGTYQAGEILYHDTPIVGGNIGWVCVTAGTPGVWQEFGEIGINESVNRAGSNYTFQESDLDRYVRLTGSAGDATVPSGSFLEDREIYGEIEGGAKTFVAGTGVTLRYPDGQGLIAPTGSRFIIKFKSANDALVTIIKPYTSTEILSVTATLDFPVIAAGDTERLTTTVTGAALLDPVVVSGPDNIYNSNNSTIDAWVSAANTVTVRVRNNGASSIDPGEGQFKIKVFK